MGISFTRTLPPIEGSLVEESLEPERQKLYEDAQAQVAADFPNAKFHGPQTPTPEELPVQAPQAMAPKPNILTIGNPEASNRLPEIKPVATEEHMGLGDTIGHGAQAGVKAIELSIEAFKQHRAETLHGTDPDELRKKVVRQGVTGAGLMLEHDVREFQKLPQEVQDERLEKARAGVKAVQDELKGISRPHPEDFWKNAAFDATSSLVYMAPALATAPIGGTPVVLTTMGLGTYYSSYAEHRAAGADMEKASQLASVDGIVEAATEMAPVIKVLKRTKLVRKFIETFATEILGENAANYVQTATAELAKLKPDATEEDVKAALASAASQATQQIASTSATTLLAAGAQAGAVRGVQAAASALSADPGAPAGNAPPPAAPPPGSPPAGPQASAAPRAAPAAPAAAPAQQAPAIPVDSASAPQAGGIAMFKPGDGPGAVVQIQKVNPESKTVQAVRIDPATGDPITDADGNPQLFIATFDDLQFSGGPAPVAKPAAAPAPAAPVAQKPSAAPPAATTAEPTTDIVAQVKDMYRAGTPRRGVYVSPETVAKMQAEGTYDTLKKTGVVSENFDGQGGTLIVKSKKDLEEAVFARDTGMVDMQEIVGRLTGAGVKKPNTPKPAAVVRKDETGAPVQATIVEPAAAPATAAQMSQLPGSVEVTTPEAVVEERAEKVAAEAAAPAAPKAKVESAFEGADFGIKNALMMLDEGAATGRKIDVRETAQAVGVAAQMLRKAAMEAGERGAPPEIVAAATDVAKQMERLTEKGEIDFVKSRGVSEPKLRAKMVQIQSAMTTLEPYRNAARTAKPAETPKTPANKQRKNLPPAKDRLKPTVTDERVAKLMENESMKQGTDADNQKNQAVLRERQEAEEKAKVDAARADMPPKVREAVEAADKIFRKEQERRQTKGTPPEGTERRTHDERRAEPPKAPEVGATGMTVAPPGEKVVHRKKKYVPPKKTAEQVAEQVAEATAPKVTETIEVRPSAVQGDQQQFFTALMGATPQELQNELGFDESGRMRNVVMAVIKAMGDRNSWAGWFNAITQGGVLPMTQRTRLFSLIREYAGASRQELPAVREQMLGLLTNVEGKTLPQAAIAGVFEGANVARTYSTLAQALRESVEGDENMQEIISSTTTEAVDVRDLAKDTGKLSTARENEIGGKARTKPTFDMPFSEQALLAALKLGEQFAPIRRALRHIAARSQSDGWMRALISQSIQAQITNSAKPMADRALPTTHEILDGIIQRMQGGGFNTLERVLLHLRAAVPNLPVEFIPQGTDFVDDRGVVTPAEQAPGGRFLSSGMIQVQVYMGKDGLPQVTENRIQTIIHEFVHAATAFELSRNRDGAIYKELTRLREEILEKARDKIGADKVNTVMAWFEGDRSKPLPPELVEYEQFLYGLSNNFELLSETFSGPQFHSFVRSLDQSPTRSWFRQKFNALVRAISRLLGFKNPADGRLLNDLFVMGLRTMTSQRAFQNRLIAARDRAYTALQADLRIPAKEAFELANRLMGVQDGKVAPMEIRGYGGRYIEHAAFNAYEAGPGHLTRAHAQSRATAELPASLESPPRLKNHEQIAALTSPRLAGAAAGLRRLMTSRFAEGARDRGLGFLTTDFIVQRGQRLFGALNDVANPLVAWKRIRDIRRSHANKLRELAEKTVNIKWMKLSPHRSEKLGDVLQQSTLWQIDPSKDKSQPKLMGNLSQKRWEAKVDELNAAWAKLDSEQKDLYHSIQKYFQQEYAQLRRASVDLAIQLYGQGISDQQRTMLYALRDADKIEQTVGPGKLVDMGDQNEKFTRVLRDLIRVSAIQGPYFPLMRKGNLVVEAGREGMVNDDTGKPQRFTDKAAAQVVADQIRLRAPRNTAKVVQDGTGGFNVQYKIRNVSFHESRKDAEDAIAQLKKQGFEVVGDVYTRKLESVESASLTEGLKELVSKAQATASGIQDAEEQQLVLQTIQSAFVQILAERAASASQQLKRQGVEGFKGKEAHEIFARRVNASSWHYANLKTALDQSKALGRLRQFSRDASIGARPSTMSPQDAVLARGRTLSEVTKRLRVEGEEINSLDRTNMDFYLGQLGFINFLATPSYTMVNTMQNFNVALPYITGKYGMRGAKSLMRGMKVVIGPAFANAFRGLVSKPGEITVYDVYSAIAESVADHPRFAKFTKAGPNGEPSALQQLVDIGVINASFVQELAAVANNQNLTVARGMEWLRLFPQGAELFNRISTSLAVLDATNGNVEAAAEAVWKTHFDYSVENRPRFFRKVGAMRLPQALTMFKMYGVGMYQLMGSLIVDAAGRRGQTMAERRQASTALAGVIAAHTLSAGIIGGIMIEPLRMLRAVWNAIFGDDDEFEDLDTAVMRWANEVTGSEDAGRLLSRGIWNALGFDLSSRMGLDRIMVFNPPEEFSKDSINEFLVQLLGPVPSMIRDKSTRAYELAVMQGKPFEAIMELIPVKMLQDARRSWGLVNEGVNTSSGENVVGSEEFNWIDAVGRAAGFRTTEESISSEQAGTTYRYGTWRTARVRELTNEFWSAYESDNSAAQAEAVAAIGRFNKRNPGAPITNESLTRSRSQRQSSARERKGQGRNPDLNELLQY